MKYLKIRDKKNRIQFQKKEVLQRCISLVLHNEVLSRQYRLLVNMKYLLIRKETTFTKIKDRCIITNTGRSVNRSFRVSKMIFRKLVMEGRFLGMGKASW